jgi:hypothetical protein
MKPYYANISMLVKGRKTPNAYIYYFCRVKVAMHGFTKSKDKNKEVTVTKKTVKSIEYSSFSVIILMFAAQF